ncbi:MAG: alpha/beta fold hydrolase [Microcoleaceae cyanobacterium]
MNRTDSASSAPLAGNYWQWQDQDVYYVHADSVSSLTQAETVSPTANDPEYPSLLLIHGFGASTDHWRKNISALRTDFDVWAIDLLGFGRSDKPEWEYCGSLWQDQIISFIQEKIQRPTVIAGNSLGGYVALCAAVHCSESGKGLILLNSAGPFSRPQTENQNSTKPQKLGILSRIRRSIIRQGGFSFLLFQWMRRRAVIRRVLKQVYLDQSAVTDQLVEEIYRPSCSPGAAYVFASVFKSPSGETVDELLGQLHCPLLLLWGEGDPWMDCRGRSEKFQEYYDQITEHFLQAGHCPHDEVPDQVNPSIKDWMLSLDSLDPKQ